MRSPKRSHFGLRSRPRPPRPTCVPHGAITGRGGRLRAAPSDHLFCNKGRDRRPSCLRRAAPAAFHRRVIGERSLGALEGVRVVDLSIAMAGPLAAMRLGDSAPSNQSGTYRRASGSAITRRRRGRQRGQRVVLGAQTAINGPSLSTLRPRGPRNRLPTSRPQRRIRAELPARGRPG